MTGTDGRFYDSHFDYNHDGKLDLNERICYDEMDPNYPGPRPGDYPRGARNPFTLMMPCGGIAGLIAGLIWIAGFLLMIAVPPLGALLILAAVTITEKCR